MRRRGREGKLTAEEQTEKIHKIESRIGGRTNRKYKYYSKTVTLLTSVLNIIGGLSGRSVLSVDNSLNLTKL